MQVAAWPVAPFLVVWVGLGDVVCDFRASEGRLTAVKWYHGSGVRLVEYKDRRLSTWTTGGMGTKSDQAIMEPGSLFWRVSYPVRLEDKETKVSKMMNDSRPELVRCERCIAGAKGQ